MSRRDLRRVGRAVDFGDDHVQRASVIGRWADDPALSREEASLFFRLLVRRDERGSLIVTSNKSFADWGEVFNDQVLATAILDRLLHHATTLNIKGERDRLREKKAELLGRRSVTAAEEVTTDAAI